MNKIMRVLGVLFITMGLIVIVPIINKKVETNKMQKQLKIAFENEIKNEIKNEGIDINDNSDVNLNEITSSDVGIVDEVQEVQEDEISMEGYKSIGILEIPSIDLSQMVVDGTSDETLQYFLGRLDTTVSPGDKGNLIICGHRVSDYTDAFVNLYKVEIGDLVTIKTINSEYTYVIDDKFIVNPDESEVLDPTDNASITLITCTVGAKQRLILKGSLL